MGFGWQWHQLDHMQTVCTLLHTGNHTNTSSVIFYSSWHPTNSVKALKAKRKLLGKLYCGCVQSKSFVLEYGGPATTCRLHTENH